jgi:hypothetical protein
MSALTAAVTINTQIAAEIILQPLTINTSLLQLLQKYIITVFLQIVNKNISKNCFFLPIYSRKRMAVNSFPLSIYGSC